MSSGMLLVDKPEGATSRSVVNDLMGRLGLRRVGHAGTLDPFARGLLLVLWGKATSLVPYLHRYPKEYEVVAEFGRTTDTQDATGRTLDRRDASVLTADVIRAALPRYRGRVLQTPPMFSAVRAGGRRLHELARGGVEVERPPRERRVHALELLAWEPPRARFRVVCETGTYVRTLVHDLGAELGPGACAAALVRTAIGPHRLESALSVAEVEALPRDELMDRSVPPAQVLPDWADVRIDDPEERRAVVCGSWRDPHRRLPPGAEVRLTGARGELLALARGGDPPRLLRVLGES